MSKTTGVIIKSQFKTNAISNSKSSFKNYVNYMDRSETHTDKNDFESYQDYMSNEEKSTGLFTNDKDFLSGEEKEKYKNAFKYSQEKGSVLWQDVISFDNEWLKELGVLKEQGIDEKKLKEVTRSAVNEMLKTEKLSDSTLWTGAIHYNTDNIHIHVATVQTKNFRERGKRKPSSIDKMKSAVVNKILDRSQENQKLNDFIRKKLVGSKKDNKTMSFKNKVANRDMVKQFQKIHSMLPKDKRQWKYNMNGLKAVRPEINKFTDMYIDKYLKKEFEDFNKQLDKEVEVYKKAYGNNSKAERYKETKIQDMYTRMGNTVLGELKEFDKNKNTFTNKNSKVNKFHVKRELNNSMFLMNRYMKDDLQHMKNQRAFEQLEREAEMER